MERNDTIKQTFRSDHEETEHDIAEVKRQMLILEQEIQRNEQLAVKSRLGMKKDISDIVIAHSDLDKSTDSRIQSLVSKTALNAKHIDSLETRVLGIPDMSGVLAKLIQLESKVETLHDFSAPEIQDNSQAIMKQIADLRLSISRDGNTTSSNINKLSAKVQSMNDKIIPYMDSRTMTDSDVTSLIDSKIESIATVTDSKYDDLHENNRSLTSRVSMLEKRGDTKSSHHLADEIITMKDEIARMEDDFSIRDSEVDSRFIGFDDRLTSVSSGIRSLTTDTNEKYKSLFGELSRFTESTNKSIRDLKDITGNDSTSKKISDLEHLIDKIQSKLASVGDTSSDSTRISSKLQSIVMDLDSLNRRMSDLSETVPSNLLEQLIELHSNVQSIDGKLGSVDSFTARLNELSSSNSKLMGTMSRFANDSSSFNLRIGDLSDRLSILQSLYETKQETSNGGSVEIKSLLDTLKSNFTKYGVSIDTLSGKHEGSLLRISDLEDSNTRIKSQLIDIRNSDSKLETLRQELSDLSSRFDSVFGNDDRFISKVEELLSSHEYKTDSKFTDIQKGTDSKISDLQKRQKPLFDSIEKRLSANEENIEFQDTLISHLNSSSEEQKKLIDEHQRFIDENTFGVQIQDMRKEIKSLQGQDGSQRELIAEVTKYVDSAILDSNTQNESVFSAIQTKFESQDSKFGSIDSKFGSMDSIFAKLRDDSNSKFEVLSSRIDSTDVETNKLLSKLSSSVSNQDGLIKKLMNSSKTETDISHLTESLEEVIRHVNEYESANDEHASKLSKAVSKLSSDSEQTSGILKQLVDDSAQTSEIIEKLTSDSKQTSHDLSKFSGDIDRLGSKLVKFIQDQDAWSKEVGKQSEDQTSQLSDLARRISSLDDLVSRLKGTDSSKFGDFESAIKELMDSGSKQSSEISNLRSLIDKSPKKTSKDISDLKEKTKEQDSLLSEIADIINANHDNFDRLPKLFEDFDGLSKSSSSKFDELKSAVNKLKEREDPTERLEIIEGALKHFLDNGLEDFNISMIADIKSRLDGMKSGSTEIIPSFDVNVDKKGGKYMFSGEGGGGFEAIPGFNGIQGKLDPTTSTFQTARNKSFMFNNLVQFKDIKSYGGVDANTGHFGSITVSGDVDAQSISGISILQLAGEPYGSKTITVTPRSTQRLDIDHIVQNVKVTHKGWVIPSSFDTYIWKYDSGKLELRFGNIISSDSSDHDSSNLLVTWY